PIVRSSVIEDLIHRGTREIRELHLYDRAQSSHRRSDRSANNRVLTDRRVQHAIGKFFGQTFRRFESASESSAHVLAVNENALVVAQQLGLRFTNRFEISDAHSGWSTNSRVEIAHQSSFSASGAASFCAVAIASSTCLAASSRHDCSVASSAISRSTIFFSASFKQSWANGCRFISSVT